MRDVDAETTRVSWARWDERYAAASRQLMDVEYLLGLESRIRSAAHDRLQIAVLAGADGVARVRRVGVFAGSFNPLTVAHEGVIQSARVAAGLDMVLWAFSLVTVDKERVARASVADRAAQMDAFLGEVAPLDGLIVMDAGLYADQATALASLLSPDSEQWLIVGFDKVVQIFDPRYYDDRDAALAKLFRSSRLLVAGRGGEGQYNLTALLDAEANRQYAQYVRFVPSVEGLAEISSTAARHATSDPAHLAPHALADSLAPEGAALAVTTSAYAPPEIMTDGDVIDHYGLRLQILASLAEEPKDVRTNVDLAGWMARVTAPTAEGRRLRHWLRGERWAGAPTSIAQLVGGHTE